MSVLSEPRAKPIRVAFAGVHRQLDRELASHSWAAAFASAGATFPADDSAPPATGPASRPAVRPRAEAVGVFDRGAETRDAFRRCWGDLPAFDDYGAML